MKTRKKAFIAALLVMAITVTSGAAPIISPEISLTAFSDETYTMGKDGVLTYYKYSDHIEINKCDMSATSAEIPEKIEGLPVTAIQMYAFQISSVKSVKIPNTVKEIGNWAFSTCSNLTSITIPDSVEKIGIRAFEGSSSLSTVEFPDHLIEISSAAFEGTPWLEAERKKGDLVIVNGAVIDGQKCEGKVEIPSDIKYVSPSAFARNSKITSAVFPASVTKLSDNTFFYCDNLTSVELKGVTFIDSMALCGCPKLTELKISGKLEKIDGYAFADTTSTATITFYGSKEAWEKVEKPKDDTFLKNAKMVFDENYVEPETTTTSPDPKVTKPGDANCDNEIDMADAVLIMQALANPNKYGIGGTDEKALTAQGAANGDVDIDVKGITSNDALKIQEFLLGKVKIL